MTQIKESSRIAVLTLPKSITASSRDNSTHQVLCAVYYLRLHLITSPNVGFLLSPVSDDTLTVQVVFGLELPIHIGVFDEH